jgi:rubredoxin
MNCQRCNGLAVYDDSFVVCTGSSSEVHAWRCVNCGMIVDEVIHRNQQAPPRRKTSGGSKFRQYGEAAA